MRLKGFDYRTPGFYFVTVCQRNREHLFSIVSEGRSELTSGGRSVANSILEIPRHFDNTGVDSMVVMPNHVHILIALNLSEHSDQQDSLIDVMNWWKSVSTTRSITGVNELGWQRFNRSLWQEGYHDRIVRNQRELEYIRYYIEKNPSRWDEDTFYDN